MDHRIIITLWALTVAVGCDVAETRPVEDRSAAFQFGDVTVVATVESGSVHTEVLDEDLATLFEDEALIDYGHAAFDDVDFDVGMDLYLSEVSATTYLAWKQEGGEEDHLPPIYLDCQTIVFAACITEICGSEPHGGCVDNFGAGCVRVAERSCEQL